MNVTMLHTRYVAGHGEKVAHKSYDDMPPDVCRQLIRQGLAIETPIRPVLKRPQGKKTASKSGDSKP